MAKVKEAKKQKAKAGEVKQPKAAAKKTKTAEVKQPEQVVEETTEAVAEVAAGSVKAEKPTKKKAAKPATEATSEKPAAKPKARTIKALTKVIATALTNSAMNSVRIGEALEEAKARFEKAKDWLVWCDEEFAFKKSTVYSYLNIAQVFGSPEMQELFKGVAYRTLGILASNSEILQDAIAALEEGKVVDTAWLNEWKEAKAPKKEAKSSTGDGDDVEDDSIDRDNAYIDGLLDQIESLKQELDSKPEATSDTGSDAEDETALGAHFKAVAERLKGLDPLSALNLQEGADKKKINVAKRDLSKLYHPDIYGELVGVVHAVIEEQAAAAIKAL